MRLHEPCLDEAATKLVPWSTEDYMHSPGDPIGTLFVDVPETARMHYIMDLLLPNHHYVMLVGNPGTGKTAVMSEKLKKLNEEDYITSQMVRQHWSFLFKAVITAFRLVFPCLFLAVPLRSQPTLVALSQAMNSMTDSMQLQLIMDQQVRLWGFLRGISHVPTGCPALD
eukprot:SAG22_NODE_38_length_26325_cov_107.302067_26_plen_169_part_00